MKLEGMGHANLLRYRAAADNVANTIPHLGKSLTNHQVIPAVAALSSAAARTDLGKVILSSTGGNPAKVADAVSTIHKKTMRLSPHDKRALVKKGLNTVASHANSVSQLL